MYGFYLIWIGIMPCCKYTCDHQKGRTPGSVFLIVSNDIPAPFFAFIPKCLLVHLDVIYKYFCKTHPSVTCPSKALTLFDDDHYIFSPSILIAAGNKVTQNHMLVVCQALITDRLKRFVLAASFSI